MISSPGPISSSLSKRDQSGLSSLLSGLLLWPPGNLLVESRL